MRSQLPSPPSTPPPSRTDSLRGLSGAELDAELRKRIEKRIEDRNGLIMHLIVYLGTNVTLWYIYASSPDKSMLWPLFIMIPWTMAMILHVMTVYQGSAQAATRRERKVLREMEIEKQRLGITDTLYEKPKRDQHLRLSDDGELVPADEYEDEAVEIAKSKQSAL